MAKATIGEQLIALKDRSGLTLDEIAQGAGYAGRSSVQEFFKPYYDPIALAASVAQKLVVALAGKGRPPIRAEEIWALVGADMPSLIPSEEELEGLLKTVHAALPPGLPLSEWFPEVAAGLRSRLELLANDRAKRATQDDQSPEAPPKAGRRAPPSASDHTE